MLLDEPPNPPPPNPPPPPPPPPNNELAAVIASFAAANKAGADQVQRVIDELRSENADHRTKNRDLSARWAKLAESVGLTKEATPDDIAAKLGENVATLRTVKVEREVEKAAAKHNADADLVMALIHRDKALDGIEDDKLTETAEAKVKEYVDARPNLKLASARPPRSGPPIDPNDTEPKVAGLGGALREKMMAG